MVAQASGQRSQGLSSANPASLWAELKQAGLVEGDAPPDAQNVTPWYIRTMLGVAGWVGAMFLLGFVGAAFSLVVKSTAAAFLLGSALCAAAVMLYRVRPNSDFVNQFALAVSIAGQALICVGLGQFFSSDTAAIALLIAVLEVVLFLLIPNFLHRVLSAGAGAGALVVALSMWGFYPYMQALVFAAFSWAWLHEFGFPARHAQIRALGYGLTLLVLAELAMRSSMGSWRSWVGRDGMAIIGGPASFWIGAALVGTITLWVVWKLLVRQGTAISQAPGYASLAGAVLIALISVKAPGVGITVTMLLLGFANANRVLTGLGILSLLAYWSYYYYSLEFTLLEKSAVLICAGLALIAARLAMARRWPIEEARDA
jgi:hypothetical protein